MVQKDGFKNAPRLTIITALSLLELHWITFVFRIFLEACDLMLLHGGSFVRTEDSDQEVTIRRSWLLERRRLSVFGPTRGLSVARCMANLENCIECQAAAGELRYRRGGIVSSTCIRATVKVVNVGSQCALLLFAAGFGSLLLAYGKVRLAADD